MKALFQVAASIGAGVVLLGTGTTAYAHAHVSSGPVAAGENQVITISIGHGCEGADTYRVEVQIPEEVSSVRGVPNAFGEADVQTDDTGAPVAVAWTKDAVREADDQYYEVRLRVSVPETPFQTLYFPTVQSCRTTDGEERETAWDDIDVSHDDEDADPAPSAFILPARSPGWNKWTAEEAIHDLSVFDDAVIVWAGDAAYSGNEDTMNLIEADAGVEVLEEIEAGTEIWVRY